MVLAVFLTITQRAKIENYESKSKTISIGQVFLDGLNNLSQVY